MRNKNIDPRAFIIIDDCMGDAQSWVNHFPECRSKDELFNDRCPVCRDFDIDSDFLLVSKCRHAVCLDCFGSLAWPPKCPLCRSRFSIVSKISKTKEE